MPPPARRCWSADAGAALVSRLAHQDDDDLHRLRGAEGRPPDARHAASLLASMRAACRPRSSAWRPGGTITVEQGLQSLVARSANDVATAFGERISGSEPAFAQRMTETAKRLGMTRHPVPQRQRPARSRARSPRRATWRSSPWRWCSDFPQYYGYFHTQDFMLGKQQDRARHQVPRSLRALCRRAEDRLHLRLGLQHRGQRGARRAAADRRGASASAAPICATSSWSACSTRPSRSRPPATGPKIWQLRNGEGGARPRCCDQDECGRIRYDMPGDAVWLGTYGDWQHGAQCLRRRPGRARDARRHAARQGIHPARHRPTRRPGRPPSSPISSPRRRRSSAPTTRRGNCSAR